MNDKDFLKMAVEQAKKSVEEGGFPAGAIVVKDGKIIAEGVSLGRKLNDPTEHAETSAIRKTCHNIGSYVDGATLYGSLECCNMCFSVANWSGISRVVYGCRKTPEMVKKFYYEGSTDNNDLNESNNHKIEIVFIPDFEQEMLELVKNGKKK
jgi:tRNA(Arg) A34 adenosine deaminase TadA